MIDEDKHDTVVDLTLNGYTKHTEWVIDNVLIKIPPEAIHEDERGVIINLTLNGYTCDFRCTEWITIKAGSVRSQHYHISSSHACYLAYGKGKYLWRKVGEKKTNELEISKGDMIFTPNMVEHAFIALEEIGLVTLSDSKRSKHEYESDVVRLKEKLI